jgi:Tol biopolymer transport system component
MMRQVRVGLVTLVTATVVAAMPSAAFAAEGTTERVSVATDGTQGNGESVLPTMSGDGRYVAFSSSASNLVPGDTNGFEDAFVHDRQAGTIERVSVATGGTQGNARSPFPAISGDGRYVAFGSAASNLVTGDTNGFGDVFLHDRHTGTTERVSVATDGTQADGDSTSFSDVTISADGRHIAFSSEATNLVPGDTNNGVDVFVHDRLSGTTERVSVGSGRTQANGIFPGISSDGRYVAFTSRANVVPGDTNAADDVFVHDRQSGATERVSVATDGTEGNDNSGATRSSVSADGRYVAFTSLASNLVPDDTNSTFDAFVHDRQTGTTERVSVATDGTEGNDISSVGSITPDGRYVTLGSVASNLVPGDTNGTSDAFLHDRQTGTTELISVAADGTQGNAQSGPGFSSISTDGRFVAFHSDSSNLVPGDTNGLSDVFVHDRGAAATAQDQLDEMVITLDGFPIAASTRRSLLVKLDTLQRSLDAENTQAACDQLGGLIGQVSGFRAAGKLSPSQADELTGHAESLRATLGCA